MNIALFASAFHPNLGGVEELVRQLAHQLRKREDTSVVVFTNQWPRNLPAYECYEGIDVCRLPMRVPDGGAKAHINYQITRHMIKNDMLRILRERAVDLLHVQCVSSSAYYALIAKQELGLPLVVTLQGELTMDATGLFQRSAFAQGFMRASLTKADYITACSGQTLREAEDFFGKPFQERGRVIYNGVKLKDFQGILPQQHQRPYIFAVGRHVAQKGFDVLLRAFARAASDDVFPFDLLLAGDGEESTALKKLASDLNLGDRVRFVGRLGREDVARHFAGCAFFVLPSRHEPLGIVNLEAMAAGKAVIASRVGGVPEIVLEGETGLLVTGGDVYELTEAIKRLSKDPGLCEKLGSRGRTAVESGFDWPVVAEQYMAVYQQAMKCYA